MTLYLIRHGETDYNRQGIIQGSGVDTELNDIGQQQAQKFYEYYKHIPFDLYISSTLKRSKQTLLPFLKTLSEEEKKRKYLTFSEINEISWGIQEGKKSSEALKKEYQTVISAWLSGDYSARFERGESAAELGERLSRALAFMTQEAHQGKNLLVCTHGRAMLGMLTLMKNLPLSCMNDFKHQNTCLYRARWHDGIFHFDIENDTRHLV